jgi:uncharacterized coiled-coil DUF342 family protein
MKPRHRIPTIFNLSMVDVLCCALGCVILLWLLNLREAKERAVTVGETSQRLQEAQSQLESAKASLRDITARHDAAAKERDDLRRDLQEARTDLSGLVKKVAGLQAENTAAAERLAKLSREQRILTREKAEALQRLTNLQSQLQDEEALAKNSTRRVSELDEQLQDAEARAKKLLGAVQGYRSKLSAAEERAEALEKEAGERKTDLVDATRNIDLLKAEKRVLSEQVIRARAAVENRFEGIALTGRRVIFVVDMSGSMELVDEKTADPSKWPKVRETLAKVMRSLTELEKFQVLVFAEKVTYLLGNDGRWFDFDPKTSVDQVVRALAGTRPAGGTNMYDVFEIAFRFRPVGLDTIYVLSDGLPNLGPGLTPEQTNTLKETDRSEILARYIRNQLRSNWNRPQASQARVHIHTIGFFYESPDVGAFLWALARENDGSFVGMSKP